MRLYSAAVRPTFILSDCDLRIHRTVIVEFCLVSAGIPHMDQPVYSPYRNPIENLWLPSVVLCVNVSRIKIQYYFRDFFFSAKINLVFFCCILCLSKQYLLIFSYFLLRVWVQYFYYFLFPGKIKVSSKN